MYNYLNRFHLNEVQKEKFRIYYQFLIQENQKYNLTAIIEEKDVYIKHFYDSLMVKEAINSKSDKCHLLDVGSGAGFPSIPLAILGIVTQVTIFEPNKKKVAFLQSLIQQLQLSNCTVLAIRAEDATTNYRGLFDVCVARAVASLPILLELTVPFMKIGGYVVALKGASYEEELVESKNAQKQLGIKQKEIRVFDLPEEMGMRALLVFEKHKETPIKYPRNYGTIKKKPL